MEYQQSQDFNERLSQWIASQGFWFQLRYSMAGSGTKGTAAYHVLRLGARLLVFLLVLAVAAWIYVLKRTDGEAFREQAEQSLNQALGAGETRLDGLGRSGGQLNVGRLASDGGEEAFFTSLDARDISLGMGLLDGIRGHWDPGTINVGHLEVDLRAGADDAESAAVISRTLFGGTGDFDFRSLRVANATLRWGHSERTRGAIENSALFAQRTNGGWRLQFTGGRFSQNWLRRLEIVNLVAICDPEGIRFEEAKFRRGSGGVDLAGLRVTAGERPQVSGVAKISRLALGNIMPPAAGEFIEGSISGDFRVFGSTNDSAGVGFEGSVTLDGTDVITLRDNIHFLRALSVVDLYNKYRRVNFSFGSFDLKTTDGTVRIGDIDLSDSDLMKLTGNLLVRPPTQKEVQEATRSGAMLPETFDASVGSGTASVGTADPEGDDALTLRRAARAAQEAAKAASGEVDPAAADLFDRVSLSLDGKLLEQQQEQRVSRLLVYEGDFLVSLKSDAFERAEELQRMYPVDPATGRIPMRIRVNGHLPDLTVKQAEELYLHGRR